MRSLPRCPLALEMTAVEAALSVWPGPSEISMQPVCLKAMAGSITCGSSPTTPSDFAPYLAGFGSTISADLIQSSATSRRGRSLSTRSVGITASY